MARYENKLSVSSFKAAADLSARLHHLVKVDSTANQVALAGNGDAAIGVLMNKPIAGEPAEVAAGIIIPVVAFDTVRAGYAVAPHTNGRAREATGSDKIFGVAIEGASAGHEFACYVAHQRESSSLTGDVQDIKVAATTTIVINTGVAVNTSGYLVPMNDAGAVSFMGIALEGVDNSGGADGDESCSVLRRGVTAALASTGLAQTDVGREVWQTTNALTVTTTPGKVLVGVIESVTSATAPVIRLKPLPIVGQRLDRRFQIPFSYIGAVGHSSVNAAADMEFSRMYIPVAAFADAQTAPGSSYICTITLTDATKTFVLTISATATHGENKTAAVIADALKAAFDTDITMIDDNSSGATADVKGYFECEYL